MRYEDQNQVSNTQEMKKVRDSFLCGREEGNLDRKGPRGKRSEREGDGQIQRGLPRKERKRTISPGSTKDQGGKGPFIRAKKERNKRQQGSHSPNKFWGKEGVTPGKGDYSLPKFA